MNEVKIITKYREANPWEVFKFFHQMDREERIKINEPVRCLVCLETKSLSLEPVFLSTSTKEEYFTFLVTESEKIYILADVAFLPDDAAFQPDSCFLVIKNPQNPDIYYYACNL
jgi:hypothetical protein